MARINHEKKEKPRVFIGSSVEGLHIANAIQLLLEYAAEPTVWNQGVFEATSNTLDDLIELLDSIDFAVFVFSPDDVSKIRKQRFSVARDNVIFEMGLFIGRLGKKRVFYIIPRHREKFHLPSDLIGVNALDYDNQRTDANIQAALGSPCTKITERVNKLGKLDSSIVQMEQNSSETASIFTKQEENEFQYIFTKLHEPRLASCMISGLDAAKDDSKPLTFDEFKFKYSFIKVLHANIQNGETSHSKQFLYILSRKLKQIEPFASYLKPTGSFFGFKEDVVVAPILKMLGLLSVVEQGGDQYGREYIDMFSDKMYRFLAWLDYYDKMENVPFVEFVQFAETKNR